MAWTCSAPTGVTPPSRSQQPSVLILTKDSQNWPAVRICRNEEDRGVHLAVAWGQVDAGRVGFRPEHAPEAGLAGADRAAFGRAGRRDGDRAVGRQEQGNG